MFEIKPWIIESKVSNLKGKHSKLFTQNIRCVVSTLRKILPEKQIGNMCEALLLFQKMSGILSCLIIDEYQSIINLFDDEEIDDFNMPWYKELKDGR